MIYVMIQLAINCLVSYFLNVMSRSRSAFVECPGGMRSADQDHRIVSEPIANGNDFHPISPHSSDRGVFL